MTTSLAASMIECATEAGEAAANAAVTVAGRAPILAGWFLSPSPAGLAEWNEAATEKMVATFEGSMAAIACVQDAVWRSVLAPLTPLGLAHETLALVRATSRASHLRVRENAERFGRA